MSLFAISDLHLSLGTNKPMDVFGENWQNYEKKLQENWNKIVADEDTVLICGDVSWAMYLEECGPDFTYINSLKGRKIISKGNHDYWWTTLTKQKEYIAKNGFDTIHFLHNNAYMTDGVAICGARGWTRGESDEDKKIYNRELERFEISANAMDDSADVRVAVLHYPPDENFMQLMEKYSITTCVFGHLHAKAHKFANQGMIGGITYKLVSCDYLNFTPLKLV